MAEWQGGNKDVFFLCYSSPKDQKMNSAGRWCCLAIWPQ